MDPWSKRETETTKAYSAFLAYLETPQSQRSLRKLAEQGWSLGSLSDWSTLHAWQDRASTYDAAQFSKTLERRNEDLERLRVRLLGHCGEAIDTMILVLHGSVGDDAPVDERGQPLVKPSTRAQTAKDILELAGLVKFRRVELTTADGQAIVLDAKNGLAQLSTETLQALAAVIRQAVRGDTE